MSAADLLGILIEATFAITVALALVWLLRRPLRRSFGAGVGYAAWMLVPAALIAVLLPAATVPMVVANVGVGRITTTVITSTVQADGFDVATWACVIWMLGVVASALRLAAQQHRFRRALGRLLPVEGGLLQAEAVTGLPAVIGVLRPRIVFPADYRSRYSGEEQALMQAHERTHIARGDLQINALVVLLRCGFWFNPLLHIAARHFRHDQELACDQRVIARHPQSRRAYGEAMFKTQLAAQPLPLGCHWAGLHDRRSHPLKERIEMLKQPLPASTRRIGGGVLIILIAMTVGFAAWATQPANPSGHGVRQQAMSPAQTNEVSRNLNPPKYPTEALHGRIGGMVVLIVDVAADGRPTAVKVDRAEPAGVFDAVVVEAAWKWKFEPAMKSGKPVAGRVRVPVEFSPDGEPGKPKS